MPKNAKINRRERRRAKKPTDVQVTLGRCQCEKCNGSAWPTHYIVRAQPARRRGKHRILGPADGTPPKRRPRPTVDVSYECLLESQERGKPRDWSNGSTSSASAEAIEFVQDYHAGGVKVDLGETALPPGGAPDPQIGDVALEVEIARAKSLEHYLAAQDMTPSERAAHERAYFNACDRIKNERRLHRWLCDRFPGWVKATYEPAERVVA